MQLFEPTPEYANRLLSQLSAKDQEDDYCWFHSSDGRVELTTGWYGHFFVKSGENWLYLEEETYVIMVH